MNRYLINSTCIYTESKSELKSIENSCVVRMTSMRARCLTFIIENAQNGVIEKENLSTALWGDRAHYVSDANLTQLLYLIRRDLKLFGVSDLLITIPRQGIRVNNSIPIVSLADERNGKRRHTTWLVVLFAALIMTMIITFTIFDITHFTY